MPETHLTLENAADAIASVVWSIESVLAAKTVGQFSDAIRELRDARSDLATWHPEYDPETGEIGESDA